MRLTLLWATVIGCIAAATFREGGNWQQFFHLNTALMVFGPCLAYAVYFFGAKGFFDFCNRLFNDRLTENDTDTIDRVTTIGFAAGGIGALMGFTHVMTNLTDSASMATGVAAACLCFLYGLVPAALLLPLRTGGKGLAKVRVLRGGARKAAGFATAGFLACLTTLFVALYALVVR